jgi:transglutaminase-like putative cysteine protease
MTSSTVRLSLAAATATLLASAGLQPLIDDGSWVGAALVSVALVAGIGIGLRALRAPAWAVLAAQGVGLAIWLGRLVGSDVARLGWLPSRAWAQRLGETCLAGIDTVQTFQAPVPLDPGILLLVVGGVGLTAWAVDALAVTARMAPLAGVPIAVVHAVAMATTPGGPTAWAFVAAAAGYLLLLAVDGRERSRRWGRPLGAAASTGSTAGTRATSLSAVGLPLALGALVLAVTGATALPEGSAALFGGGSGLGGGGGQSIRTENPIVDLKRDLVRPDNVEVIRYTTDAPDPEYLRLLTLDIYDGTVWRTADRPVPEDNRVTEGLPNPPGLSPTVGRTELAYQIEITENLQSQWLPLPYPAAEVRTADGDWRYHAETLDVVSTDRRTDGLRYDVTSLQVQATAEDLAGLPPLPGRFLETLSLPDDLPAVVRDLAREVTADSENNFERAVALQTWFRNDGGFVYDLAVNPGNGSDDLISFLDERRGYCEQYAASMAIMARVLGIPSRVAVGYLRGEQTQPGFWIVRAQDAHAWPELFFEGIGWVRFEPTPGSRTGSPPSYTVPGSQAAEIPESLSQPVPTGADDSDPAAAAPLDDLVQQGPAAGSTPSRLPLVAVVAVLVLLALTPVLAGWASRRRRWIVAGDDPARQAEAAWADILDAALEVGVAADPADTIRARAATLESATGLSQESRQRLAQVARATERARYAPQVPPTDGLQQDAAVVRQQIMAVASRRTRWQAVLWPAPMRRLFSRR